MADLLIFLAVLALLHTLIGTALMVWSHHASAVAREYERDLDLREFLGLWWLFAVGWSWAVVKTIRGDIPEGL